jgi:hypothetical protein
VTTPQLGLGCFAVTGLRKTQWCVVCLLAHDQQHCDAAGNPGARRRRSRHDQSTPRPGAAPDPPAGHRGGAPPP